MNVPTRQALLCAASSSALMIGSAALAIEPEPVEYVRICDAFGNNEFYIPGTDTCLRMSGYVRVFTYTPASEMTLKGFAYEPTVLVNPFDMVDFELEGRGVTFGLAGQVGGAASRWGYVVNLHFNEVEGRGVSGGSVPNVGITAVGETPGLFIPYQTNYTSHASAYMHQWGALFEKNYLLHERAPTDPSQWRYGIKALAGLHYTNTDSDINYGGVFHYDTDKATSAYYATNFTENTLTPYVGAAVGFSKKFNNFDLGVGLTGRVGASFSSYDGTDRLSAYGDNTNASGFEPFQQTDIDENAVTPYVSFGGGIGFSKGPATLSFTAAAEYGAYRNPNIYRPDSLDASTPLPTEIDPESIWTYNVGLEFTYRFRPQRSF